MTKTTIKNYLIDMDGVLVHGRTPLPGASEFLERLKMKGRKYLILTNNPIYTPGDLAFRLKSNGLNIDEEDIFTSALATAMFLDSQMPHGKVFVIGESGLTTALHNAGFILTDIQPDYVVVGETNQYNFEVTKQAIRLIAAGARFILTNPDANGLVEGGLVPGAGAMGALIEKATGKSPFVIGKPNPLMMRTALNYLDAHSEETAMIGDRMDTDIAAGVMSGLQTILVLSGVTNRDEIYRFPYRPNFIYESVADIEI